MKKLIFLFSLLLVSSTFAKSITLQKESHLCSVGVDSKEGSTMRINNTLYYGFKFDFGGTRTLPKSESILELRTSWLNNDGRAWQFPIYVTLPKGNILRRNVLLEPDDISRNMSVWIDDYFPCECFPDRGGPKRCRNIKYNEHDINVRINDSGNNNQAVERIRFRDQLGNWWEQTGQDTARRVGKKTGEGARKAWEAIKGGAHNLKKGWDSYQPSNE